MATDIAAPRSARGVVIGIAAVLTSAVLLLHPEYDSPLEYFGYALRTTAWIAFAFFMLAYVARPLVQLTGKGRWLVRNRRYLGLSVALVHTVHFGYIVVHTRASETNLEAAVLIGGGLAFVFMWLMTLTSNDASQRALGANWKRLHRSGMHFMWLIFTYTFLGSALVNPAAWTFVAAGLAGAALRAVAWVRQRGTRTG